MAVKAILRSGIALRKGLAIAAVIDEESEHRGSYSLVDIGLQANSAIVTEPSDMRLLLGCKGTAPIEITFHGKIAHGSNPWLGVSAVKQAAKAVLALEELPSRMVEMPRLGTVRSSINIGLIGGGTAYNNVPHECTIHIDRRMVPGETQDTCLIEIQEVLDRLAADDPEFKATMRIARPDWKWDRIKARGLNPAVTPIDAPISQAIMRVHEMVYGQPVELGYTNGYMDMDFLVNDLHIPTVNYGPGDTVFAHREDERLDIDELIKSTHVYALTALETCL
jgi:acetylornithine deacetylase/succinyl-diaminopimelate desuccinylase-like protein